METITELDHRRTKTSYVTVLPLYLSVSSSSSSLLYSSSLLTLSLPWPESFSFTLVPFPGMFYIGCAGSNQTHKPYIRTFLMFCIIFCSSPSASAFCSSSPPLPLFSYSWNNAIWLSWCNIMQTFRNPLEDLLPLLNSAQKAIWLKILRSGWSALVFQPGKFCSC